MISTSGKVTLNVDGKQITFIIPVEKIITILQSMYQQSHPAGKTRTALIEYAESIGFELE